jgi:hypothetical protein
MPAKWSQAAAPASLLLSVHEDGRYVVDGNGQPFLPVADANWTLGTQLQGASNLGGASHGPAASLVAGQDRYLALRASQGFNTVLVMAVTKYHDTQPNDHDGVAPFTTPGDFTTYNPVYFGKLKALIDLAATYNQIVVVPPVWAGYNNDQGWGGEVAAASDADLQGYGEAIGAELEPCDNLVWMIGGDRFPPVGATLESRYAALTAGIRSVDSRHIITSHWNFAPGDTPSGDWEDIVSCYNWNSGIIYPQVRQEYAQSRSTPSGHAPIWLAECVYEPFAGQSWTRTMGRLQTIACFLEGAKAGLGWGHMSVWHGGAIGLATPAWQPEYSGYAYNLTSAGALDHARFCALLSTLPWHLFEPSTGSALVTSGRGTFESSTYVTAAITPSGSHALIYAPNAANSFNVDCDELAGPVTATWWDPTNGATVSAGTGLTGSQAFSRGTANAGGDADWVLILVAA